MIAAFCIAASAKFCRFTVLYIPYSLDKYTQVATNNNSKWRSNIQVFTHLLYFRLSSLDSNFLFMATEAYFDYGLLPPKNRLSHDVSLHVGNNYLQLVGL